MLGNGFVPGAQELVTGSGDLLQHTGFEQQVGNIFHRISVKKTAVSPIFNDQRPGAQALKPIFLTYGVFFFTLICPNSEFFKASARLMITTNS
jgi:hypothetical protein